MVSESERQENNTLVYKIEVYNSILQISLLEKNYQNENEAPLRLL